MKILCIGIASYKKMKERTMAIACGELKPVNVFPANKMNLICTMSNCQTVSVSILKKTANG
jgi:hypothetical protein